MCGTCNRFNQAVSRAARKRLADRHPDEYEAIRISVERDLYPLVIERFIEREHLTAGDGQ